MVKRMSVCGVLCSDCPAYHGDQKGVVHQERTAAAWRRIYGLNETPEHISCGGCWGPDDELFHTSRTCQARRCCRCKSFSSCAKCPETKCQLLEKAQSVWDGVPQIGKSLSHKEFVIYAKPYCNHRQRLAKARRVLQTPPH